VALGGCQNLQAVVEEQQTAAHATAMLLRACASEELSALDEAVLNSFQMPSSGSVLGDAPVWLQTFAAMVRTQFQYGPLKKVNRDFNRVLTIASFCTFELEIASHTGAAIRDVGEGAAAQSPGRRRSCPGD
jgi:hypothetical protein